MENHKNSGDSVTAELAPSVKSLRSTAIFFAKVADKLPKDLDHGADIIEFAEKHRIEVPQVLDGFSINYNLKPSLFSKKDLGNAILVELPPRDAVALARSIKQCFDVKKGPVTAKICVKCSVSWNKISCSIEITITVGF